MFFWDETLPETIGFGSNQKNKLFYGTQSTKKNILRTLPLKKVTIVCVLCNNTEDKACFFETNNKSAACYFLPLSLGCVLKKVVVVT